MPVVTVNIREGRTQEQKQQVVDGITDAMVKALGLKPDAVTIIIYEIPRNHYAKGGKVNF